MYLSEAELGGGDEGAAHEHGEDGVAGHVVAVDDVHRAARVIREDVGVVQCDADEQHRERPAERAEHALASVAGDVVVEVAERRRVRHRDRRRAQELADHLQRRQDHARTRHGWTVC